MDAKSNFHTNAIKSEIRKCIIDRKANSCPMAVRLAWHASGTYSKHDGTGGNDGATMRFAPESEDGANAGLGIERDILKPVKEAFPDESIADIWALAGASAIEFLGGPEIDVKLGRTDATSGAACPVVGRLPDASQGAQHLRDVFHRMGFNDEEIVALSGAHTLGSCHKTRSGFDGPWTRHPLKFDNTYFKNLLELTWRPRKWSGPMQCEEEAHTVPTLTHCIPLCPASNAVYRPLARHCVHCRYEDEQTGQLMMLPTDLALTTDSKFKPTVQKFAKDEQAFKVAFKHAYEKLLSLGCPAKCMPDAAGAAPVPPSKVAAASRALREFCMHGSLERAQAQLAEGAEASSVEVDSGRGALHKAAFWGHDHIIPWLLKLGCNPNIQDAYGDTPLHDAARFGHRGCVTQLVGGGASRTMVNKKGQTAADVAVAYGKEPHPSLTPSGASMAQTISKGVLTALCLLMILAVDMPTLFFGTASWEANFVKVCTSSSSLLTLPW